ncbi:MAG: CHAT domain-containing protein [Bernardetiaceae bacterium]|nr:CHAT domain-containing protein [Bernardetiaceae bacterium]
MVNAQKTPKYWPLVAKAEEANTRGDFGKAVEELTEAQAKLRRKDGARVAGLLQWYVTQFHLQAGSVARFDNLLNDYLAFYQKDGPQSPGYAAALTEAALFWGEYGHPGKTASLADQAANVGNFKVAPDGQVSGQPTAEALAYQLLARAKVAALRGDFAAFARLYPAAETALSTLLDPQTPGYDPVANQTGPVPDEVMARRQFRYASLLILRAQMARLQGNYAAAEGHLAQAEQWQKERLGRQAGAAEAELWVEKAAWLLDKGASLDETKKLLDRAADLAEKAAGPFHPATRRLRYQYLATQIDQELDKSSGNRAENWAEDVKKALGDRTVAYAEAQTLIARHLYRSQDYAAAQALLKSIEGDAPKLPRNHPAYLQMLQLAYQVAIANDDYGKATQLINDEIDNTYYIYGDPSLPFNLVRVRVATHKTIYTNDYETVRFFHRDHFGRQLRRQLSPQHVLMPALLSEVALFNEISGEYDSALAQRREALALTTARFGEGSLPWAIALNKVAKLRIRTGDFSGVAEQLQQVTAAFGRRPDAFYQAEFADALQTQAQYYLATGQFELARTTLLRADKLYSRTNVAQVNSTATDDLADLYLATEQYAPAEALLTATIDLRQKRYGRKSRFLIRPLQQMARWWLAQGEYGKAEALATEALNLSVATFEASSVRTAEPLAILADAHAAMGDYAAAQQALGQVIALQTKALGPKNVLLAQTLQASSLVRFYRKENPAAVETDLRKAAQLIADNLGQTAPLYAESLRQLALVEAERSQWDDAAAHLNQAATIWNTTLQTPNNTRAAQIALQLGDLALRTRNPRLAETRYASARDLYKNLLGEKHPGYMKTLGRLARLYYQTGRWADCERNLNQVLAYHASYVGEFFPAFSYHQKLRYWNQLRPEVELFYNVAAQRGIKDKNLLADMYGYVMFFKSLLIGMEGKAKAAILESRDSTLVRNYRRWVGLKQQLTQNLAQGPETGSVGPDLASLQKQIEELEQQLAQQSASFAQIKGANRWLPAEELGRALQRNEAAVEIVRFNYFDQTFTDSVVYAALLLGPGERAPTFIPLPDTRNLEDGYLKYYRNSVKFSLPDTLTYRRYWQPVHTALDRRTQRVFVAADGVYNQLNLEALRLHDSTYLIDQLEVVPLTNTAELAAAAVGTTAEADGRRTRKDKTPPLAPLRSYVFMGNPVFYKDLAPDQYQVVNERPVPQLPGTYLEVEALTKLLKSPNTNTAEWVTTEATEARLKALRNPTVVHVATHGFFQPDLGGPGLNANDLHVQRALENPLLRSGLLLRNGGDLVASGNPYNYNREDGVLTAYEAADLRLEHTELVVLSACETGRGQTRIGEGVYSLQRAFRAAGAKSVIMSLFKVDDEATRQLMTLFYTQWLQTGHKRAAFIHAKKELRKLYPEPLYWGAFVMLGVD